MKLMNADQIRLVPNLPYIQGTHLRWVEVDDCKQSQPRLLRIYSETDSQ